MREKSDICPICNQYRKLRSINYIYDRIRGLTIAYKSTITEYLCYPCRKKIDRGLKEGKRLINLNGTDRTVSGYGLPRNMDIAKNELRIDRITMNKAVGFIDYIYRRWIKFDPVDKFKYHFASLFIVLKNEEKKNELEEFIKDHHTNFLVSELNEKVEEIKNWANKTNLLDSMYDSL